MCNLIFKNIKMSEQHVLVFMSSFYSTLVCNFAKLGLVFGPETEKKTRMLSAKEICLAIKY